jgi:hypothetical protein
MTEKEMNGARNPHGRDGKSHKIFWYEFPKGSDHVEEVGLD